MKVLIAVFLTLATAAPLTQQPFVLSHFLKLHTGVHVKRLQPLGRQGLNFDSCSADEPCLPPRGCFSSRESSAPQECGTETGCTCSSLTIGCDDCADGETCVAPPQSDVNICASDDFLANNPNAGDFTPVDSGGSTGSPTTSGPSTTTGEPTTTEPTTTEPSTTEPSTTEPSTTEPSTTEPSTTEPSTTEPSTTEPSTTEQTTTEPSTTEPSTTEPSTTEPSTTEPSTTEPSTTEPSTTEQTTNGPTTTEPSTTEPTTTETTTTTTPPSTEENNGDDDDDGVCFPGTAVVHLADGNMVNMEDLFAGHNVLHNEHGESSKVFLFTHRTPDYVGWFHEITTESGHMVTMTGSHYLYANGKLTTASSVRRGDEVRTITGVSTVKKVRRVQGKGLYAPHSMHGDLVVGGVVVSGYSKAVAPGLAHALLAPVRWLVKRTGIVEPLGELFYNGGRGVERFMLNGRDQY